MESWVLFGSRCGFLILPILAILIIFLGVTAILTTSKDIFPQIRIPVVTVIWQYTGLSPKEMEVRVATYSEYSISSSVTGIRNIESQTLEGIVVERVYFQPNVNIELAISQIVSASNSIRALMPTGIQPPITRQHRKWPAVLSRGAHAPNLCRDWNHAPDFFPASRFRNQFNRPDIVKRVLDDLDEETAIAEVDRLAGAKPAEEVNKILPPVITILSPTEGDTFDTRELSVRYTIRSPSGLPVSEVRALIDGRPLPDGTAKGFIPTSTSADIEHSITLTGLPQRDITLSLVAGAGDIESVPFSLHLRFRGVSQPTPESLKGSLYAVVVGVGTFKDRNLPTLRWAAKDARDFALALKRQEGRLYKKVEVRLLPDEGADNTAIINSLAWLGRQVHEGDVGVVFLSGHGVTDPSGDYYFVPYNAEMENTAGMYLPIRSTSVPDTEISHALRRLVGDALFFFDTCHAGQAASNGGIDYSHWLEPTAGFRYSATDYGDNAALFGLENGQLWRIQGGARLGTGGIYNGYIWSASVLGLLYDDVSIRGYVTQAAALTSGPATVDQGKLRALGQLFGTMSDGQGWNYWGLVEVRGGEDVFAVGGKLGVRYQW